MHTADLTSEITWIFGRGASIACGLHWKEDANGPKDRGERIGKIYNDLSMAIQKIVVKDNPYNQLLFLLEDKTKLNQKHFFVTTNWDFLLQQEVNNIIIDEICPSWLLTSHVFHLNGSIEKWGDGRYRTPIILPDDEERMGVNSLEFREAKSLFAWTRLFVIVGLSFGYKVDIRLMEFLKPHADEMPFGEGKYLIVNNCQQDLDHSGIVIKNNFPRADVVKIACDFKSWVNRKCPDLWQ